MVSLQATDKQQKVLNRIIDIMDQQELNVENELGNIKTYQCGEYFIVTKTVIDDLYILEYYTINGEFLCSFTAAKVYKDGKIDFDGTRKRVRDVIENSVGIDEFELVKDGWMMETDWDQYD